MKPIHVVALGLAAITPTLLAACAAEHLPSRLPHIYQDYLTLPHYRAFAHTGDNPHAAYAGGQAWGYPSVEAAVAAALEFCRKSRRRYVKIGECHLHSIGNLRVYGMSEDEMAEAVTLYQSNSYATNALLAVWPERGVALPPDEPGPFDGAWQGVLACGDCANCAGPIRREVSIEVERYRFELAPDTSYYAGEGLIDTTGKIMIRPKPDDFYGTKRPFSFFGAYRGKRFALSGERGPRACELTLQRVTAAP